MKVVIIGGSNSLKKEGWTSHLPEALPGIQIVNQSIGATPSLMGYYRLTTGVPLAAGDVVVWEYALNDEGKIKSRSYTEEAAHRHIEMTVRYALSKGASFIPLVFSEIGNSKLNHKSRYSTGLSRIFSAYGLTAISATNLYGEEYDVDRIPDEQFRNAKHYSSDSDVIKLVVQSVLAQIETPVVPRPDVSPIYCAETPDCVFLSEFEGGRQFEFKNSILQLAANQPLDDSPLQLKIPAGEWTISGAILLRSKKPRAFNFEFGGNVVSCTIGYRSPKYSKPILGFKPLSTGPHVTLAGDTVMNITRAEARHKRKRAADSETTAAQTDDHGVICLILEPARPVSAFNRWFGEAKKFLSVKTRILRLGRKVRNRILPSRRRRKNRRR